MGFVVLLATLLLIALLTTYLVIENNRKKAIALKKQLQNERIDEINTRYLAILQKYGVRRIVKPKHINILKKISTNFFVMQNKNEASISVYENEIGQLTELLENELANFDQSDDKDTLTQNMDAFIDQIPSSGHQFNQDFYEHQLANLRNQIATQHDVLDDIDSIEDACEPN